MASRGGFRWTDRSLSAGVKRFGPRMDKSISGAVEYTGMASLASAKSNARWTDRTGNARNGLGVEFSHVPMVKHGFSLYHSVPYGIWLEVRWSGKYGIIKETIQRAFPALMARLRGAMR